MKYNKPQIVAMSEAVRGIQGQVIKAFRPPDNTTSPVFSAAAAYESDE